MKNTLNKERDHQLEQITKFQDKICINSKILQHALITCLLTHLTSEINS